MNIKFLNNEIESCKHNIEEAKKINDSKSQRFIKRTTAELGKLEARKAKLIREFNKAINFDNCHMVVEYLIEHDKVLIEALVNEYNAQIQFGEK